MKKASLKINLDNKTYLADAMREKDMTISEVARLTADPPVGYCKLSKQTVSSHAKGTSRFDLVPHALEYKRILNIPLYRLLNPHYPCCDVILYYDNATNILERRSIAQPAEVIFFPNWEYVTPTWKAIYYDKVGNMQECVDMIDLNHKNMVDTPEGREHLYMKTVVLECDNTNNFLLGHITEFIDDKNKICSFRWWKGRNKNLPFLYSKEKEHKKNNKKHYHDTHQNPPFQGVESFNEVATFKYKAIYPVISTFYLYENNFIKSEIGRI